MGCTFVETRRTNLFPVRQVNVEGLTIPKYCSTQFTAK